MARRNKDLRSRRRTAVLIIMIVLLAAATNLQALADGRAGAVTELMLLAVEAALLRAGAAGLGGEKGRRQPE